MRTPPANPSPNIRGNISHGRCKPGVYGHGIRNPYCKYLVQRNDARRAGGKSGGAPVACRTNATQVLFAFRLFSFVITDAGTQLRKYLAGSDAQARARVHPRRRGGAFAEYFCLTIYAFVYARRRRESSAWISRRGAEARARARTFFYENRIARRFCAQNEIPLSATFAARKFGATDYIRTSNLLLFSFFFFYIVVPMVELIVEIQAEKIVFLFEAFTT